MHRFPAPQAPEDFEAKMKPHRDAARASLPKPVFDERVWKAYKAELSRAQSRKCAFCEVIATGASYGDVEHYHPKGAVWDIASPGEETRDLANVAGRKHEELSPSGYWWLAYSWENWLLSCEICNRGWKRSFFPVANQPRDLPPDEAKADKPLLLNPFRGPRPIKHLRFGRLGEVEPRRSSRHGRATIAVCGLNRPSLRDSRLEKADLVYRLIDRLADETNPQRVDDALRDILRAGREDAIHCGMVRGIFEEETGTTWRELEEVIG